MSRWTRARTYDEIHGHAPAAPERPLTPDEQASRDIRRREALHGVERDRPTEAQRVAMLRHWAKSDWKEERDEAVAELQAMGLPLEEEGR